MKHCSNLSAAIYMVLFDRMAKRVRNGQQPNLHISDILALLTEVFDGRKAKIGFRSVYIDFSPDRNSSSLG